MNLQKLRPQNKIVDVNNSLGNKFVRKMQGTTKIVYDTLPIDGSGEYVFFRDTNSRTFPFTNVKSDSLPVAESLSVQRISLVTFNVDSTGLISSYTTLGNLTTTEIPLIFSDLSCNIANDTVMRPIAVQNFIPEYNKTAYNDDTNVFEMNTDLIIPPQLDFSFILRAPTHTTTAAAGSTNYIRLVVEGVGSQFNGKVNF
jgi:hypothetical protein|tara:strand:- start:171 stop:767 length:597 start_codon:yes stop_codon:yes gene_type:complete